MKRNIVLVANWMHDIGGVQTATRSLRRVLGEHGSQVAVVSVLPSHATGTSPSPVTTLYPTSRIRRAFERSVTTKVARLDVLGREVAVARLRQLARGADVVIAMDVFAAELAARAVPARVPVIAQFHNSAAALEGTRDLRRLLKIRRRLTALVALTPTDAERFRELGFDSVAAIPNAIHSSGPSVGDGRQIVLGVGRYTPVKRFDLLIRSWQRIPAGVRAGWQLHLYGEGPARAELERLALGEQSVAIHEPSENVPALLESASVLVLPSAFEGLPMVLLEAMAAGVPCIATMSSPGVSSLVGGAGWLVPVDSERALAEALTIALTDAGARDSASSAGLERIEQFSPSAVAKRWDALLPPGAPR